MSVQNIEANKLLPNPFRELNKKYYNEDIIEELMTSMKETGVWAGILARQKGDKYEIAFGHHRLEAMKRLGIKEAPVDVRDHLTDLDMIKHMAYENMSSKATDTKAISNVVGAAKTQLEQELKECKTWEDCHARGCIADLFNGKKGFDAWKADTKIGRGILVRFLGNHWTGNIETYLSISAPEIDIEAAQMFDKPTHAEAFVEKVKEYKIPKDEQQTVAKKIKKEMEKPESHSDEKKGKRGEETTAKIKREMDYDHFGKPEMDKISKIQKPELREVVASYIRDLKMMKNGMENVLENWEYVPRDLQREYISTFTSFVKLHTKHFEGDESWNAKMTKMLE
jgi:hypothetical protein